VRVFRYYKAEHGLKVLNDLEIRASIPNALNDPFELSPNIDPAQFTQRKCESFLRQEHEIDYWYERESVQRGFSKKRRLSDGISKTFLAAPLNYCHVFLKMLNK
jgi:hypothetical protein